MKIYTRSGDRGTTSLVGGTRVAKNHPRLDAYGTIDELNSHIGLLNAMLGNDDPTLSPTLTLIQNKLFDLGTLLATEPESKWQPRQLSDNDISTLEEAIDTLDAQLPAIRQFILPGGTAAAAQAHVARTVTRRAERLIISLAEAEDVAPSTLQYINRISDFLFLAARYINKINHCSEIFWQKDC